MPASSIRVSPRLARIASTVIAGRAARPLAVDRGGVDDEVARPAVGEEGGGRRRVQVEQLDDVRDAVADEDAGRAHRDEPGAGRHLGLEAPDGREVGGLPDDERVGEAAGDDDRADQPDDGECARDDDRRPTPVGRDPLVQRDARAATARAR